MKIDLKGMTRRELEKLRNDVDKALNKIAETEKKAALAAAQKAAKAHGFSLDELTGEKTGETAAPKKTRGRKKKDASDGRGKVEPKFRNPENPEQTWSGRGRAPKWMQAHLDAGGKKEDFAI